MLADDRRKIAGEVSELNRKRNEAAAARNAEAGDHLLIDVKTTIHDQKIDEASANDFLYELGSATLAPELPLMTAERRGLGKFDSKAVK